MTTLALIGLSVAIFFVIRCFAGAKAAWQEQADLAEERLVELNKPAFLLKTATAARRAEAYVELAHEVANCGMLVNANISMSDDEMKRVSRLLFELSGDEHLKPQAKLYREAVASKDRTRVTEQSRQLIAFIHGQGAH